MFKKMFLFIIKDSILEAFKQAENKYRRGNGEKCLNFATEFICKKHRIPFKKCVKNILQSEFYNYSDVINNMIIRERVKLCRTTL